MNRPCEGGAKSGAAFFYAQILFHFSARKIYAPEHPAEPPPRPVCTRSPLCVGCPYPANGFLCWGKDGKCLRSEMRRLNYWLFGHYHGNKAIDTKHILLWEQIVQIL